MTTASRVFHWTETTGRAWCGQRLGHTGQPDHLGGSGTGLLQVAEQYGNTPEGLACAECVRLAAARVRRLGVPTRDEFARALSTYLDADKCRSDWVDGIRRVAAPVSELADLDDRREAALRTLGALAERLPGGVLHDLVGTGTTFPRPPIDAALIAGSESGQVSASADPEGTRSALDAGNGGES